MEWFIRVSEFVDIEGEMMLNPIRKLARHTMMSSTFKRLIIGLPPDIDAKIREQKEKLLPPVIWLLGKTQSGKSSILRGLTGDTKIVIGSGFQACTRDSSNYYFPSKEQPLLNFLDTRGLFEAGYDPSADIAFCEEQAHLLMVVIKLNDHAIDRLISLLRTITKRHKDWSVIVVLTHLHDCYEPDFRHIVPYPYAEFPPSSPDVPDELKRHLVQQRKNFEEFNPVFVPIDFTMPEDGYEPQMYGIDHLINGLEEVFPAVVWQNFKDMTGSSLKGIYFRKAQPIILFYSLLSGGLGAFPIPVVDIPVILGIQAKMLHSIANIYNQKLTWERFVEFGANIGLGFLLRRTSLRFIKMIPAFGQVAAGIIASSETYALGNIFCIYFQTVQQGKTFEKDKFRELFQDEFARAKKMFKPHFRKQSREKDK